MSATRKVLFHALRVFLILAIVASALVMSMRMIRSRPQARREPRPPRVPVVQVVEARQGTVKVGIEAMGTVVPSRTLVVQPEVTGRVMWHHPSLVDGGTIAAGEDLLRIDGRDYETAVRQQQAAVDKAEANLRIEEGRKAVAEQEWSLFQSDITSTDRGRDLALREPQLRTARADLEAAREGLEKARLNVERTAIAAPFNALVLEETVETGQLVTPQSRLATLVGTDEFWVQVSVPVARLGDIDLPRRDGTGGASAVIRLAGEAGDPFEGKGRVLRLLGDLEPVGRMARLIVSVPDPLGHTRSGMAPLLLGSYVRVVIEGREQSEVFALPRSALREHDVLWMLTEGTLETRPVEVLRKDRETVYVGDGLDDGEKVITSSLPSALPGMRLKTADQR